MSVNRLILVLGDQLNRDSRALDALDPATDRVWMAEVVEEATHVWSHKARIALFLSAMRHFRDRLRAEGLTVRYGCLGEHSHASLQDALGTDLAKLNPREVVMVQAGEWRVQEQIEQACSGAGVALRVVPDEHFICSHEAFAKWASGRKALRLEQFYQHLRKQTGVLTTNGAPVGGKWNFDKENRRSFGTHGPGKVPRWPAFPPDRITREVLRLVQREFPDHPGSVECFDWPVTAGDAEHALRDFLDHRLPRFGPYQDAMWTDEPFLFHSGLSASLNLKLLEPARVVTEAAEAWAQGRAPLPSVEGFVRQVLGWREYIRGVYWRFMPDYAESNALVAELPLPGFYWSGDTDMLCLRSVIEQTLQYGYAHHIQRLMVTGLFALLLGVRPQAVHAWYLAVYVDAVEWVELPNTLGMSQYADGGLLASKPYVASGQYIRRMSNYCRQCRYDPARMTGDDACPFTTLYWDFLQRHQHRFGRHPRTALQWKNLARHSREEQRAVRRQAAAIRSQYC